jgi:hypothetical protein
MKTRQIYLALLILCFSCETDYKSVSKAQREKTKGEIKEVVPQYRMIWPRKE